MDFGGKGGGAVNGQFSIFGGSEKLKIGKPIRLIELFA